ncbi:MAG TPA: hypothetical protein PKA90_10555 [Ignavibacteria bacterium]|nr:hypothetical protein [Ignavibacteria bacterium]HMR40857.1 hypothetical protein [Ignavibacteria bacterium]
MKKNLLIVLLFALFSFPAGFAFSKSENRSSALEEWTGVWSGKLDVRTSDGKSSTVEMTLTIEETGTPGEWKWITNYGGNLSKDYILKTVDPEKGLYLLDENNSIVLDYFFSDNAFYNMFSVQKNILFSKYLMSDGEIHFEVISAPIHSPNVTGNESDETGLVDSYPVYAVQKAVLRKQ